MTRNPYVCSIYPCYWRLSGATRWVGVPIIQLGLRHKSDDQFWFSFFHEAGHVLNVPRRRDYVDSSRFPTSHGTLISSSPCCGA